VVTYPIHIERKAAFVGSLPVGWLFAFLGPNWHRGVNGAENEGSASDKDHGFIRKN
jgi:hypothetical protein